MSLYVLMKVLESAPSRYDRGIRILTLGAVDGAYDRLTSQVEKGQRVLDIGCGTGALTLRAAGKGAIVKGIDVNSQMLEIAQTRLDEAGLSQNVRFCEMGVAELGCEQTSCYDVVMSGLCFSELSGDELTYTLKEIKRILKPGGLLLIADEVTPKSVLKRVFNRLIRCPLAAITYLITQTTTHAVKDLAEKIEEAGFLIGSVRLNWLEDFIELAARNPGDGER